MRAMLSRLGKQTAACDGIPRHEVLRLGGSPLFGGGIGYKVAPSRIRAARITRRTGQIGAADQLAIRLGDGD